MMILKIMINWKKYKNKIPHVVKIGPKDLYEVLWVDNFIGGDNVGETRFNEKQIVIKTGMTPKLTVTTYLHECLHALSDKYDLNLTEKQVLAFEKSFTYLLLDGNLFKK